MTKSHLKIFISLVPKDTPFSYLDFVFERFRNAAFVLGVLRTLLSGATNFGIVETLGIGFFGV